MNLTRKQIKQERHKLLVKETYGAWKLNQFITEENLEALKDYDFQVPATESIKIRIDALREMNISLQEKYFDNQIENLIRIMDDEGESRELISKEYAMLEELKGKDSEIQQESNVNQVKLNEDGHSRMPIQMLSLIEEETDEKQVE
ncbi:hypothetical protein LIZ91_06040 [Enterococcus avium]|uniref:hypothetical protein n=1 Tax=Enterococcus avium TaxID=33945 RepID=UPI001D0738A0|nr:hypothetical protein [Enterococcus avium]MCB6916143.1 hypothetical protein [Enterococcus avium]MCQ4960001.1 hypothetical protein [Enterococcus avium]